MTLAQKLLQMPGSVANCRADHGAAQSLSRAFVHTREYPVIDNEYRNGESQRSVAGGDQPQEVEPDEAADALALADAPGVLRCAERHHEPFYFYDPYETNPKFSYDPTGAAVTGRYIVRFNSDWSQSVTLAGRTCRSNLIELA